MRIGHAAEGECPKGLLHLWDGTSCVKCGAPDPAPTPDPRTPESVTLTAPVELGVMAEIEVVRTWDWDALLAEGWKPDWDMRTYIEAPAVSASGIRTFRKAPAKYRWARDHDDRETKALKRGTLAHVAILEPDRLDELYTVAERCDSVVGGGERKGLQCLNHGTGWSPSMGWVCGSHAKHVTDLDESRTVITPDEHAAALMQRANVMADPKARKILETASHIETSGVWKDPATGLWCKIRPDALDATHYGAVVSVKSTKDASFEGWPREVVTWDYHVSAGHYRNGSTALGFDWRHHIFILVENVPPYLARVTDLSEADVQVGQDRCAEALERWAKCEETGHWPGYEGYVTTTRPYWAWNKDLDE